MVKNTKIDFYWVASSRPFSHGEINVIFKEQLLVVNLVFLCCNENKENILFLILEGISGSGSESKNKSRRTCTVHDTANHTSYYLYSYAL